jgi:WD40 repeat protein
VSTHDAVVFVDASTGGILAELDWPGVSDVRFLGGQRLFVANRGRESRCHVLPIDLSRLPEVRVGRPRRLAAVPRANNTDPWPERIGVWDGARVLVISPDDREVLRFEPPRDEGTTLALSPGGEYAALGSFTGAATTVWDLRTGRRELEVPAWQGGTASAFSPDGRLLVVLRRNDQQVFETAGWRRIAVIPRRRIESTYGSAAFSPDGRLLAVATTRSRVQVLATATFEPLLEFDLPDDEAITELCFDAGGETLACGSGLRAYVHVWDLRAARVALRELGLDWSDAPIPEPPAAAALRVVIER